jgi:hypothetical protein
MAAPEEEDADGGDGAFGDDDGPKDSAGAHAEGDRQKVGQGNLHQPEAEEIHNGWGDGISRAVEGLKHDAQKYAWLSGRRVLVRSA